MEGKDKRKDGEVNRREEDSFRFLSGVRHDADVPNSLGSVPRASEGELAAGEEKEKIDKKKRNEKDRENRGGRLK